MKTSIRYEGPEAAQNAINDMREYLGQEHFEALLATELRFFNPCTWTMRYFEFHCSWLGVEGFPAKAFAWRVMQLWEACYPE